MNVILFSVYYCKLQLSVFLGIRQTANPLDWKWRRSRWECGYKKRRGG